MIKRLEKFYSAFGDKGVMFCIYALTLVINALFTISAELPAAIVDETSSAGVAAFYSGKDWSALLCDLGMSGYIQQFIYAPLFRMFRTPYALYKAMLVENAMIVSFIPLIAYHIAGKAGVVRVKKKLLCALCSGMYATYIANSKLIRNDVAAELLTWVLIWCVFAAWDKKNRYTRFVTSLVAGFLCAVGFAADNRMIVTAAALVLTAVIARIAFKERIFNMPVFFGSLIVSFIGEHFVRLLVAGGASGGSVNSIGFFSDGAGGGFLGRFFGMSYVFITESFGMGALAAVALVEMIVVYIRECVNNKPKILEDGTKVYEKPKHKYALKPVVFGMFQLLAAVLSIVFFSLFTFGGETADLSEICMSLEHIIPLSVFFALLYIVMYGSDLKKLFAAVGVYSLVCAGFSMTYYAGGTFGQSGKIVPVLPFRIGEALSENLTGMSFIIMSSCVFSVFALLIVFTSCSRKRFMKFIAFTMYSILIYNTAYVGIWYLPETARLSAEKTAPYKAASELLYNDAQSPPIIVAYDSETSRELAGIIQFLNFNTNVSVMKQGDKVPESCLLVAENDVVAPFDGGSYDVVGRTGEYVVYAYGESARDFIRYSSSSAQ